MSKEAKPKMVRSLIYRSLLTMSVMASAMLTNNSAVSGQRNQRVRSSINYVVQNSASSKQPAMVRNGQPGEMHRRLDALVGSWNVEMTLWFSFASIRDEC